MLFPGLFLFALASGRNNISALAAVKGLLLPCIVGAVLLRRHLSGIISRRNLLPAILRLWVPLRNISSAGAGRMVHHVPCRVFHSLRNAAVCCGIVCVPFPRHLPAPFLNLFAYQMRIRLRPGSVLRSARVPVLQQDPLQMLPFPFRFPLQRLPCFRG